MRRVADTNVIVHLLVKDDDKQLQRALDALREGVLFVEPTVLLETEWVLRGVPGYKQMDIEKAFADLLALPNTVMLDEEHALQAIELHEQGMDFADALHLVGADEFDEFVTFDRDFAKRASRIQDLVPVRLL